MRRLALAALLLLAACGDDGGDDTATTDPPAATDGGPAGNPGGNPAADDSNSIVFDVAGALTASDGTVVRVTGFLIALPDGTAELCGGPIAESAPPQCGDPALPVDGLEDPASLPGTTDNGTWVEGEVVLAGTMQGGRLTIA